MTGRRLVSVALVVYGVMAAVAWVWRTALMGEPLLYAGAEPTGLRPVSDLAAGLATGLGLVALSRWLTVRTPSGEALARRLAEVVGPLTGGQIAVLALSSGIAEEAFFRGALQPRLGLLAASALFGLAHLVPSWPLVLWSVFACAAGALFGALFERTGNLVAPVAAHVAVNGLNLRWLVLRYARASAGADPARN